MRPTGGADPASGPRWVAREWARERPRNASGHIDAPAARTFHACGGERPGNLPVGCRDRLMSGGHA
jgi:hypothetical protein